MESSSFLLRGKNGKLLRWLSSVLLVVQLNKSSTSNSHGSTYLGSKDESTAPSLSVGVASKTHDVQTPNPFPFCMHCCHVVMCNNGWFSFCRVVILSIEMLSELQALFHFHLSCDNEIHDSDWY